MILAIALATRRGAEHRRRSLPTLAAALPSERSWLGAARRAAGRLGRALAAALRASTSPASARPAPAPRFGFAPALSVTALAGARGLRGREPLRAAAQARGACSRRCGAAAVVLALVFPGSCRCSVGVALGAAALGARHRVVRPVRRGGAACAAARPRRAADAAARRRRAGRAGVPLLRLERLTFRFVAAGFVRAVGRAACSAVLVRQPLALGPQDGVLGARLGSSSPCCWSGRARFGWRGRTRDALALRRRRAAAAGLCRLALRARGGAARRR